jgi:hypothetical protein
MRQTKNIDLRNHLSGAYQKYSGRGMMGQQCPAFVYDSQYDAVMDMICATSNAPDDEQLYDALADHRFDSLGMNVVLYFPSVSVKP